MGKQRGRPRKIPVQQLAKTRVSDPDKVALEVGTPSNAAIPTIVTVTASKTLQSSGSIGGSLEKQPTLTYSATVRRLEMPGHTMANPPTSDFEANRVPKQGSQLSYIAPVLKQGTPTACLNADAFVSEASKWANAIIMYVIDDCPSLKYINTFISKHWNCISHPDVFYHNEGYYVVRFASLDEKNTVLCAGPYTIANRPVIVKSWAPDFDFQKELGTFLLTCWGLDSLSRIGSTLGNPLFADECTSKQSRISYARLLVEIDVTRPLLDKVLMENALNKGLCMTGSHPFVRSVSKLVMCVISNLSNL